MIARAVAGLSAVALGVLCALALGCGSSGSASELLRDTEAAELKDALAAVRQAVDDRDVGGCAADLRALRSKVENLPDARRALRTRLEEEIKDKLAPQVRNECDDPKTEKIPTTTEEAPTESTEPTEETPPPPPPPESTTSEVPPPPTTPTPTQPDPGTDPGGAAPPDSGADPGGFGPGSVDPGAGAP